MLVKYITVGTSEVEAMVKKSKEAFEKATMLVPTCYNAPISLTVETSDVEVVTVQEQPNNGAFKAFAFFIIWLRPPTRRW